MNFLILIVMIGITIFTFIRDKKQYEDFKSLKDTKDRQKFFIRWTIEPFILYGFLSVVLLFWIGQIDSLKVMPNFLVEFIKPIKSTSGIQDSNIISGFLKGLTISIIPILVFGSIIGTYLKELKDFKDKKLNQKLKLEENDFRNLDSLIPKNYTERIWGAILSINAGISEEMFFRILAPILIYSVSGSTLIAIMGSTLWFGLGHYYQGISGIAATFFVGLLFFSVYLITQNIWITMIIHAILDLNGLVFSPWLKERFERQKSIN